MNTSEVKEKLIGVLQSIQSSSGMPCPPLVGTVRPVGELEGFDSKIWPVAIGILSVEIGIEIPDDMNIFVSEDGETALSIDQVVAAVCKLGTVVTKVKEAAE